MLININNKEYHFVTMSKHTYQGRKQICYMTVWNGLIIEYCKSTTVYNQVESKEYWEYQTLINKAISQYHDREQLGLKSDFKRKNKIKRLGGKRLQEFLQTFENRYLDDLCKWLLVKVNEKNGCILEYDGSTLFE